MRPDCNQGPQQFRVINSNNLLSLFGQHQYYTPIWPYLSFKLHFSWINFFSPWIRGSIINTRRLSILSFYKWCGLSNIVLAYVIWKGSQASEPVPALWGKSPGQFPRLFPPAPSRPGSGIGICPTRDRPRSGSSRDRPSVRPTKDGAGAQRDKHFAQSSRLSRIIHI